MRVSVLGANSFIGQHFISHIRSTQPDAIITTWSYTGDLESRLGQKNHFPHFKGIEQLEYAINEADVVVNLHEYQDLSLIPDEYLLRIHNLEFVRSLMFLLPARSRLIHLSSCFVQCSSRWPNVNEPETPVQKYRTQWPFPAYCKSKSDAEDLITSSDIHSYIMRCVPVYGPGDDCSILTDLIKCSQLLDIVPRFGDTDSVIQMAFVKNVVDCIWTAASSLIDSTDDVIREESDDSLEFMEPPEESDEKIIREVLLVADETKKNDVYSTVGNLIASEKRPLSSWSIPVAPLFYLYLLFATVVAFLSKWIQIPSIIKNLPDPCVLYFYFYHWTFFNTSKSYFLLGYKAKHSYEDSLSASRSHYRCIPAVKVVNFSWKPRVR